jgi:NADH dehydrogenase
VTGPGSCQDHPEAHRRRLPGPGRLAKGRLEVVVVNPTDYFLYLPLLPEVAAGILDPRTVAAPLAATGRRVRHVLGAVADIDTRGRQLIVSDPEGNRRTIGYDQLVIALGSVNKLLPIPGVADHAHGFRSLAETMYLRDHLLRQIELADLSADRAERHARCAFVVVGAGYTGTEVAAHLQLLSRIAARRRAGLAGQGLRWILVDLAPRIMPELGVRPDPMVARLGLPLQRGRLTVDEYLTVPGHPEIHACGDAAAVPDLTRPGSVTAMTAQHAQRQGNLVAENIAASCGLGSRTRRPYRHHDLGFVVDLGGVKVARAPWTSQPLTTGAGSSRHRPVLGLPDGTTTRPVLSGDPPQARPASLCDAVAADSAVRLDAVWHRPGRQLHYRAAR